MPATTSSSTWFISADELINQTFQPVEFAVANLLPVGLVILAGPPKVGKSFFALQASLAVTNGVPFLDRPTTQGDVLFLGAEDSSRRLKDRVLDLTEYDRSLTTSKLMFAVSPNIKAIGSGLEEQLYEWAKHAENPRMIVIDNYGRVLPETSGRGARQDGNYQSSTLTLSKLQDVANQLGVTILLVHHTNKNEDIGDVFSRTHGSVAINGVADAVLILGNTRGTNSATLNVTGRDLPEVTDIRLQRKESQWALVDTPVDAIDSLGLSPQKTRLLRVIAAGHSKTGEIAKEMGIKSSNASTQLGQLVESGYLIKEEHGQYDLAPSLIAVKSTAHPPRS